MTNRVPLDSKLWSDDYWSGVDDPRATLEKLNSMERPDAGLVSEMLEGTYYVDNPSPHFFYLIPYVLDIFEQHLDSMLSPLKQFCSYMHRAKEGNPKSQWLDQLWGSRDRIVDLLVVSMANVNHDSRIAYYDYQALLAGLATVHGMSDLGRQIMGIPRDTHIN